MFSDGYITVSNTIPLREEARATKLKLHDRSNAPLVLFRVFLGGVRIETKAGKSTNQNLNFFVLDSPKNKGFSLNEEISKAFPGLGVQDRNNNYMVYTIINSLEKFFNAAGTNKGFFEVILNEVVRSFVAAHNANDLSAFIYAYRALEHMSYALPFFHARHSKNYVKAFNDLRALISSGDGELKFCDKFIHKIFKEDPAASVYKYKLEINPLYSEKFKKYINSAHGKYCTFHEDGCIEIEFLKAFGFIVDVRNKFFHHLSGSNESASSKQIQDADAFFRPINKIALSVIAIVLGKIIYKELED